MFHYSVMTLPVKVLFRHKFENNLRLIYQYYSKFYLYFYMIVLLFLYSCACHNLCIIMILPHDKDANEIMTFITVNMFLLSVAGRSFFELRTKIS